MARNCASAGSVGRQVGSRSRASRCEVRGRDAGRQRRRARRRLAGTVRADQAGGSGPSTVIQRTLWRSGVLRAVEAGSGGPGRQVREPRRQGGDRGNDGPCHPVLRLWRLWRLWRLCRFVAWRTDHGVRGGSTSLSSANLLLTSPRASEPSSPVKLRSCSLATSRSRRARCESLWRRHNAFKIPRRSAASHRVLRSGESTSVAAAGRRVGQRRVRGADQGDAKVGAQHEPFTRCSLRTPDLSSRPV